MFTGIVQSMGAIVEWRRRGGGDPAGDQTGDDDTRRLVVATSLPVGEMPLGASLAVNGVCLTLVERSPGRFAADVGPETLARTTLGRLPVGDRVHLEPPLAMGDALGGHLVAGHVDGVGTIVASRARGAAREVEIVVPAELSRYLAPKGSIAIDGVSLTVNTVEGNRFGVTLVPHTLAVTLLGERPVGAEVNLEVDLIARHVDRLVAHYVSARAAQP
jgi:riboflavin synthase